MAEQSVVGGGYTKAYQRRGQVDVEDELIRKCTRRIGLREPQIENVVSNQAEYRGDQMRVNVDALIVHVT